MSVKACGLTFALLTSAVVALQLQDVRKVSDSCARPTDWCTRKSVLPETYAEIDCDGDGIPDPTCIDGGDNFGFISSKASCSDSWPSGSGCLSTCPRANGFCGSGNYDDTKDCDGDGIADGSCSGNHGSFFISTKNGCKLERPPFVCVALPPTPVPTTPSPMTAAPPPPPTPAPCPIGTCTIAEDPHVTVFDGRIIALMQTSRDDQHLDGNEGVVEHAGDKWLVKSSHVEIQARYMANDGLPDRNLFVRAIAVGGSFLKGHTLLIGSLEDEIIWDGDAILSDQSSSFEARLDAGFSVNATRSEHSSLVQDLKKENPGLDIKLPMGISLIVNRLQQHVNVAITMPRQEGQDGVCGNFNGVASDDTLELEALRMDPSVPPELSLFAGYKFA